jgi:methionine synthase II (cobalamin-independent)
MAGFGGAATVVGSFPHTDAPRLVDSLIARLPDVPAWPQLPVRDWRESMYVQYSEGLPGAVIDDQTQRIFFRMDERFEQELERFYQAIVEEDVERFAISGDYAQGLQVFLERMERRPEVRKSESPKVGGGEYGRPGQWVKGQVTGPFSFAMTVTDEGKRSLAYTPELREVAVQGMAIKARWVARRLRQVNDNVLVVLDEPYLCSFGSAFVNVPREDVIAAIETACAAIHAEGALAGLHCCGNTDWSLVLATGIDVLNVDAFQFFHGLPLYPAELTSFLERGGTLAWGIVPTSAAIEKTTAPELLALLDERIGQLADKGLDRARLNAQMLLTPSCGLGTQTVAVAERVLDTLVELSALVRARILT